MTKEQYEHLTYVVEAAVRLNDYDLIASLMAYLSMIPFNLIVGDPEDLYGQLRIAEVELEEQE